MNVCMDYWRTNVRLLHIWVYSCGQSIARVHEIACGAWRAKSYNRC